MTHMAGRSYLPTLVRIMERVCFYIVRYRKQILNHLPEESAPLLDAVITACEALQAVIEIDILPG